MTVEPHYGHQQGAQIGYNPRSPGRPSHGYHSYFMANTRLCLGVEVRGGKESNALDRFMSKAEQWTVEQRWALLFTHIFRHPLGGKWRGQIPPEAEPCSRDERATQPPVVPIQKSADPPADTLSNHVIF